MLRWVIWTALAEPVEPDVSCMSARSSSPTSTGSIGSDASRSATARTVMPFSSSTGTATRNGSEAMKALAPSMPNPVKESSARITRAVRGLGADRFAGSDPRGGQAARDAAGPLVDLTPGVADRFVGFTGDHARRHGAGVAVHLLGESAHDNLLGFRSRRVDDIGPRANARV